LFYQILTKTAPCRETLVLNVFENAPAFLPPRIVHAMFAADVAGNQRSHAQAAERNNANTIQLQTASISYRKFIGLLKTPEKQ
jgi:hypothetical protein